MLHVDPHQRLTAPQVPLVHNKLACHMAYCAISIVQVPPWQFFFPSWYNEYAIDMNFINLDKAIDYKSVYKLKFYIHIISFSPDVHMCTEPDVQTTTVYHVFDYIPTLFAILQMYHGCGVTTLYTLYTFRADISFTVMLFRFFVTPGLLRETSSLTNVSPDKIHSLSRSDPLYCM